MNADRVGAADRPWASMLLIGYCQADTIAAAIAGALAQTWQPLQILISDDASPDGTYAAMIRAIAGYQGPHEVVLMRSPRNLGIGAHLSALAARARGELLFVTAGDDISLPHRVEATMCAWLANDRRPDLIAGALIDLDGQGHEHGLIRPSDLGRWRCIDDWLAERPHVIGAAQAWTRRLVQRFGPLPEGTVAEDLVMVFRALLAGGAITLPQPLVRYRRGGLSARRRALSAAAVRERMFGDARHSAIELPLMLADAERAGLRARVAPVLEAELRRHRHVLAQMQPGSLAARIARCLADSGVAPGLRLRVLMYAGFPWLAAPWFALKRRLANRRATA